MPHAALWVVQRHPQASSTAKMMFQCRTRLCGWCSGTSLLVVPYDPPVSMPHAALWVVQQKIYSQLALFNGVSMPHAALWVVQRILPRARDWSSMFQCRTRLCGWCSKKCGNAPHFAECFNAARGFVGGAAGMFDEASVLAIGVSMPHAALWVVQRKGGFYHGIRC